MAEAFAAAASGAGLASLAIQIVDGVVKLHHLCSKASNASKELRQLLSDLDILACMLEAYQSAARTQIQDVSATSHVVQSAVYSCLQVHQKLSTVLQSFDTQILQSGSKHTGAWASVKFALNAKRIEVAK